MPVQRDQEIRGKREQLFWLGGTRRAVQQPCERGVAEIFEQEESAGFVAEQYFRRTETKLAQVFVDADKWRDGTWRA